ncbi:MAG TPA: GNAT family N-acetyltransferase [Candidatus Sulfopaludibacter sp.]|jgi:ribosomal-protein-alanine N-acetyltransferase|nr:GNAT family N-acetyltransferase [Candidatus Sulfopaludibacter sp.]
MRQGYFIDRLGECDLDRTLEIEVLSFGKDAYDRKLLAEYLRKCGDLFLGAWKGRKLCGYILTRISADGCRADLISVAVDPLYRRKGVAASLLESTLRRLRRRKVGRMTLMVKSTNAGAREFYEKYGFTKLRRVPAYYEDGKDGIRMVKVW